MYTVGVARVRKEGERKKTEEVVEGKEERRGRGKKKRLRLRHIPIYKDMTRHKLACIISS